MMPKISVSPAATRSSSPSCTPLRPCSIKSTMARSPNTGGWSEAPQLSARLVRGALPFHRALLVIAILVVLDDPGDGAQRVLALRVLGGLLQVEALDREMIVAVAIRPAHRGVARLAHGVAHRVLPGQV